MRVARAWGVAGGLTAAALAVGVAGCAGRMTIGTTMERIACVEEAEEGLPLPIEGPVTVETAVERALAADPLIAVQALTVKAAQHAVRAARDGRDPELRASYGEGDSDSVRDVLGAETRSDFGASATNSGLRSGSDHGEGYSVSLRIFPRNPWSRAAAVSRARAAFYAEQATLEALRQATEILVRRAYAELRYAQSELELSERIVTLRKAVVDDMKALTERGQTTVMESVGASSRYVQALSDRARRRRDMETVRATLSKLAAIPTGSLRIAWEDGAFGRGTPQEMDAEVLWPHAVENRADLAALGWRRIEARAAVRELKAERIPWLTHVQGTYSAWTTDGETSESSFERSLEDGVSALAQDFATESEDREEWAVSAGITLPVFSWLNSEVDVLRAQLKLAERAERDAIAGARHDLRSAIERLRGLDDEVLRFGVDADPMLAEMLKLVDSTNAFARLTVDEESRLREQLVEEQRSRLRAEHDRVLAQLDLEALLGLSSVLSTNSTNAHGTSKGP